MDENATRAIIIAVSVFVTVIIASIVLASFAQMRQIYGLVDKTDNSIYNIFNNEIMMYDGKIESGVGLLNALKKYEKNTDNISVRYPGCELVKALANDKREAEFIKNIMEYNEKNAGSYYYYYMLTHKYEDRYYVTVIKEGENIIINFDKIN